MSANHPLLLFLLILVALVSTADAQTVGYACGEDLPTKVESPDYTVKVAKIVSEQMGTDEDSATSVSSQRSASKASYYEDADNVLLKSAEAVRAKLRSSRSKMPLQGPSLDKSNANGAEPKIMDPAVRESKKWSLLPTVKPIGSFLKRESAETIPTVQRASYEEVLKDRHSLKRTKPQDRRMTPEELAEYVRDRRSRTFHWPWNR